MQAAEHASTAPGGAWAPVSSASAASVRIAFGVAIVVNCALYLPVLVSQYYGDTTFSFPYPPLTFARHLSELHGGAEVRADAWVSLNGRPLQRIVDPDVDLSALPTIGWGAAE